MLLARISIDFSSISEYLPMFLEGIKMTMFLSFVTVLAGTVIGFFFSLLRRSKHKVLNAIAIVYVQVIRGTPLLLQVMIIVYGLPAIGIQIPSIAGWTESRQFIGCALAVSINSGAYVCEIFRSGLAAVDAGQSEAARSLGLSSNKTMRYVVFPQALRVILPSLGNEFVTMIKETSIVSTVGLFDITYTYNIVKGATSRVFEPLIVTAVIYFVITTLLSFILSLFERRMKKYA